MSDLAATGCGCGCSMPDSCNNGCNILLWVLILSCICGGDSGVFGGSFFGGGGSGCGCSDGCGCNSWIWIIILIALIH